jgi:hypothetical protein
MSKELEALRASQDVIEPKEGSQGSGTARCYRVEARLCKGSPPKKMVGASSQGLFGGDFLTDSKWSELSFPEGAVGVPPSDYGFEEYARHGFLSYKAAQAMRWWFLADQGGISGIETRLVEYEFKHQYSAKSIRAICLVDPEQREDIMPDWGKKPSVKESQTDAT